MPRYFEDISVGDTRSFGSYTVTREEIVEFARQYDPQPFHLDSDEAVTTPFDGVVASGWHTAAMTMRVLVDGFLSESESRGALGVDELRWYEPVRPGDTLTAATEIVATEPWDDDYGKVDVRVETVIESEVVCSMVGLILFAKRNA